MVRMHYATHEPIPQKPIYSRSITRHLARCNLGDVNAEAMGKVRENQAVWNKDLIVFAMAIKLILKLLSCHDQYQKLSQDRLYVFVNICNELFTLVCRSSYYDRTNLLVQGAVIATQAIKSLQGSFRDFGIRQLPGRGSTNLRVPLLLGQQK